MRNAVERFRRNAVMLSVSLVAMLTVWSVLMVQSGWAEEVAKRSEIAEWYQGFVDSGEMPGVVYILATPDKILEAECIGYANIETKEPISMDHLFWMASTTKFFTATLMMMLVDEGKINLDDPLDKYIPNFTGYKVAEPLADGTVLLREPKTKPTVRQAISHMSGWRHKTPVMDALGMDSLKLKQHAIVMAMTPMNHDPGTMFQYSNSGIDLVGAVIENVSGMPYEEFLQTRLLDPLGMKDTSLFPSPELQKRFATPYDWRDGHLVRDPYHYYRTIPLNDRSIRFAEAGGGLFSTPRDMLKFLQMMANGGELNGRRYLSEAAVREMGRRQTPEGMCCYGLGTYPDGDGWFGHGGSFHTQSDVNVDRKLVKLYMGQVNEHHPTRSKIYREWNAKAKKRLDELTGAGK